MVDIKTLVTFEDEVRKLWEAGQIRCPVHFSGGNEEELLSIFREVKKDDYVFSTHRNHYHFLLHGGSSARLMAELLRQPDGICRGRSGSMCTIDRGRNFFSTAIVGGGCGIAVGVAWALKQQGSTRGVWCFVGDGAVDGGHFWEAVHYAEGQELPIAFVIEDNDRSTCTTKKARRGEWEPAYVPYPSSCRYYGYNPTYPHVGSGKYVQF